MNNIGPCYFTVAPMWPKSYHTTGPKSTFLHYLVRHRTLSKTLLVAGNERPPLFGCNWMQVIQLDWAKLHQIREKAAASIVSRFPVVYNAEVGKIKGYKAVIRLREGTKPIFKKSRSVAYALQPALETELTRMQQEGILEPIERSEWATSHSA